MHFARLLLLLPLSFFLGACAHLFRSFLGGFAAGLLDLLALAAIRHFWALRARRLWIFYRLLGLYRSRGIGSDGCLRNFRGHRTLGFLRWGLRLGRRFNHGRNHNGRFNHGRCERRFGSWLDAGRYFRLDRTTRPDGAFRSFGTDRLWRGIRQRGAFGSGLRVRAGKGRRRGKGGDRLRAVWSTGAAGTIRLYRRSFRDRGDGRLLWMNGLRPFAILARYVVWPTIGATVATVFQGLHACVFHLLPPQSVEGLPISRSGYDPFRLPDFLTATIAKLAADFLGELACPFHGDAS